MTDNRKISLKIFLLTIVFFTLSGRFLLAGSSPEAQKFIEDFGNEAIESLTENGLTDQVRMDRFRNLYKKDFATDAIVRFVLGPYWKKSSKEDRKKFAKLLEDYVVVSYAPKWKNYSGETFSVYDSIEESAKIILVRSDVTPSEGTPIKLDWRVGNDSPYRIYDIAVEGVSMIITQRSEFMSVIKNGGGTIAPLITALEEKLKNLKQ
ncbi:MAG: ABC transporter substrate-binding protein [Pseudomonadota bacterium]|nr:ABC transporter substrate-binding protein [Pseudomonadota bacterium]MEE3260755.1 ABC transporter substrate-binding protein [Pseudomonadota bacterium]